MIVEIFEQTIKPSSLEDAVNKAFQKMQLPAPIMENHGFSSREGGFNLLLNKYSSVIKIFPSLKESNVDEIIDDETFDYVQGHEYHPKSIPPIGIVDMGEFTLAIMPGVQHAQNGQFSDEEFVAVGTALWQDIYSDDFGEVNSASLDGELMSLDTINETDLNVYSTYEEKQLLEPLLNLHAKFQLLQQSFYDAWTEKKDFSEFWNDMEEAKNLGQLVDGWNHSPHDSNFDKKGNIVQLAKLYDDEINNFNLD